MTDKPPKVHEALAVYSPETTETGRVPEGYKPSEVGVIPEDWEVTMLGEIGKFKNGINKGKEDFGHGSPFVNLLDVFGIPKISDDHQLGLVNSSAPERELYNLQEGDVIFVRSSVKPAGVGLTTLVQEDLQNTVFSGFLIRFRDDDRLDQRFKEHCFIETGFRNRLIASSTVSANTNINQHALKLLLLPYPPNKQEQRAIAAALSDVDDLISALDELISKKRAVKTAAMQQLLTGKQRLPGFSGEWEERPLGELARVNMGQSPSSRNYNVRGVGLPLIQGNADIEDRRTIARVWTTQITKSCDEGDVVLTVRAPVGYVGIASMPSCLGRGVCSVTPIDVEHRYLFHALIHAEVKWKILEQGSTFTSANSDQISKFRVMCPKSREEQTAIAAVLSDMDAEIEALEARLEKTRQVKRGMMQELLTGRTRLV